KNIGQVIGKMAAAARALGWPEQIVEAARAQLQNLSKMQLQTMDHMMDTWEEQIKSPNPSAMLSKLKSLPSLGQVGGWPNADLFPMSAFNPFRAYMEFTEQWQKAWVSTASSWSKMGNR